MSSVSSTADRLPLSALLSQALVAFTIEFDNEAERQIQHRTARHGGTPGAVWLASMAMWLNCMRYAGPDPITIGEIARLARCETNVDGMRRWGYITLERDPADRRRKPPDKDLLARATAKGMQAREVWEPLTAVIEQRWRDRFGAGEIAGLAEALRHVAGQLGGGLPDCLPILRYGLLSIGNGPRADRYLGAQPTAGESAAAAAPLPWVLARVLLAFAIEYEGAAQVSLAISADLLRVLDDDGIRFRDLPALSGVSTESLAMATGFASSRGLIVIEAGPAGSRWKIARLTSSGAAARQRYLDLTSKIEDGWHGRFGPEDIGALRAALERLAGAGGPGSPLFAGLEPDPSGWRAAVRKPQTLPHYPMVLHRGGYPDGS
jgi:DNA-binding MarR family transcriptional regulator